MVQKSSGKNLDPLPKSEDEFWEGAEVHTNLIPQEVGSKGPHYFVRKSGREAECIHCSWGFVMDPYDVIKDGHLYDGLGGLVL